MDSRKEKSKKETSKDEKESHHDNLTGQDGDGENSSVLYKESSELSTNQQDSAYSSLKHSAYSSLDPIRTPATSAGTSFTIHSTTSTSQSRDTTSKSSGSSNISAIPSNSQSLPQMSTRQSTSNQDKKELSERPTRKKKPKMCHSPKEARNFMVDKLPSGFATAKVSKSAKVATLSQALGYVDQFRNNKSKIQSLYKGAGIQGFLPNVSEESEDRFEDIIMNKTTSEGNGFCVAVSMHDGMVLQTTASIKNVLGYPKDMWVGRNFIDFVHPQDRDTFINQVTENLGLILRDIHSTPGPARKKDTSYCKSGSFYCRIRIYNGLRSGFTVKERKTRFAPFKLSVCFLEMDCKSSNQSPESGNTMVGPQSTYLFITAMPMVSAFTQPYEDWTTRSETEPQHVFVTKHNSSNLFSSIEESVIPYLGFLPQDLNGQDIFSFVHPDDQNTLKDVFNNAMQELGRPCKSKFIRMRVRNGGYVYVNSWWSFFTNPWSRQLEFVHGKHTVKKGPRHPDVFAEIVTDVAASEMVHLKRTQATQPELNAKSKLSPKNVTADSSSKTRRELSSFMVTLLEEVAKSETKKLGNLGGKIGTVVIGNISPHQSDSSETPPSYNQLTYNENLTRFFNSQPKTLTDKEIFDNGSNPQSKTSEESQTNDSNELKKKNSEEDAVRSAQGSGGSGEQAQTTSGSGEDNGKNSSTLQTGMSAGQVRSGQDECMMSQDGSGSGSRYGSGSRGASVDNYTAPELTIDLLARHNKEMEQKMLTNYKESKRTGEIRFIRDQKYQMAQQEAINKLGIQKVHSNLQNELNKIKRRRSKQPKQAQNNLCGDPESSPDGQIGNTLWPQYGEDGPSQPRFDASKIKHAHEGYVGFNQANMMERGAPSNLTGFPNLVEVPTFYMAFRGNGGNVGPQNVQLMQSSLLMHGRSGGYLGLDPAANSFHRIGDDQADEPRSSGSKMPKACKRQRSPNHEPELPNCLAVSSCMVCQPEAGGSVQVAGSKCTKKIVDRPRSRAGSRATSIKGEPGSALESSASVSVKDKNLSQAKGVSEVVDHDQVLVCRSTTSSSSLYSFLKTSDDYSLTNPNSTDEESRVKYHVAKPVLSEPFWNEKVILNNDLIYLYQMDVRDNETVLKEDMKKLSLTMQYKEVAEQLLEANCPLDEACTLINTGSTASSEDSTSNDDSGDDKDQAYLINKRLKRKDHLEKLNMFMEADAPFPMQDCPVPINTSTEEDYKLFRTPVYSSKSSDTTSEPPKRSTKPLRRGRNVEKRKHDTLSSSDGRFSDQREGEDDFDARKQEESAEQSGDDKVRVSRDSRGGVYYKNEEDKNGYNRMYLSSVNENDVDKLSDSEHAARNPDGSSSLADVSMQSESPSHPSKGGVPVREDTPTDDEDSESNNDDDISSGGTGKQLAVASATSNQVAVIKHSSSSGSPNETSTRPDSGSNTGSMEQDDQDHVADSSQQDNLTGEDRDSPISAESGQVEEELNENKDNNSGEMDKSVEDSSTVQGPESNPQKETPEKSMEDSDNSDL